MIKYIVNGNLFDSKCQTLTNTVNCVGVMGAGIAKQFKDRYPSMFSRYAKVCAEGQMKPGMIYPWRASDHLILNVSTKDDWRNNSRIKWIEAILERIVSNYQRLGITSIAMTKLGCGLGGLDWNDVGPLVVAALRDLPILVEIYVEASDTQF
jgi:O-acetyl-ADP-ribose deacetylase (regulator of RNase III)